MKLIAETDDRLNTACDLFKYDDDVSLPQLVADMLAFMTNHKGVGLAAVQLGLPYNFFVTGFEPYLFINPDIIEKSENTYKSTEGCLSFPGLFLPISRNEEILLTYQDIDGKFCTNRFNEMKAKVIQHEIDHLQGITFNHRVSKLVLQMAEKKRQKRINRRSI